MQQLLQRIKEYAPLSTAAQQAIAVCFHQVVQAKGSYLLTEGKVCRHLYFLECGALRGFHLADGKEVTNWFAFEADFVTSFHSFSTGTPATEALQLLEGSVLWAITKPDMTALLNTYHEAERLLRIAYEKYYIRLEERYVSAQFKTAAERYQTLLTQAPHIVERVPLGYIASYLGISPETLSRIRGRI